jgi:hypothetical protein
MFDRLIFKGHLSRLQYEGGLRAFLWSQDVPLTRFDAYVKAATSRIHDHAEQLATSADRPFLYLPNTVNRDSGQTKEDMVKKIAAKDGITEGLIAVLQTIEVNNSFVLRKGVEFKDVVRSKRKGSHFYFYFFDPEFGFMHVRLQAWVPWEVQVYLNGREWLARQLDEAGVGYVRYDNALLSIDDLEYASDRCEWFSRRAWPRVLSVLAHRFNPLLADVEGADFGSYYWVVDQAEVATDVMFKDRPSLVRIMPDLVRHASLAMSSEDVVRFLGRKLHPSLAAEVLTDAKRRPEGWRVKHRLGRNWVKVYDKASVLRVETTINKPSEFRILRRITDDAGRIERRWCPMRKGVSDFWRFSQVGGDANRRYLEALSSARPNSEGVAALDSLCRSRNHNGRHYPRFNPITKEDLALFRAVMAGEHTISGFRNHDIAARLYPSPAPDDDECRRRCARVSRLIAKLRGHGLVVKVPNQRLYRVTSRGQRVLAAAISFHDEDFPAAYLAVT